MIQILAEGLDLLRTPAHALRGKAKLNKSGEVPDQEHDAVSHQPYTSERDGYRAVSAEATVVLVDTFT